MPSTRRTLLAIGVSALALATGYGIRAYANYSEVQPVMLAITRNPFRLELISYFPAVNNGAVVLHKRLGRKADGTFVEEVEVVGGNKDAVIKYPTGLQVKINRTLNLKTTTKSDLNTLFRALRNPEDGCKSMLFLAMRQQNETVLGEERVHGIAALHVRHGGREGDRRYIELWLAPDYGCEAVRTVLMERDASGAYRTVSVIEPAHAALEIPPEDWFEIPIDAQEVKPSVMAKQVIDRSLADARARNPTFDAEEAAKCAEKAKETLKQFERMDKYYEAAKGK